MPCTVYSSDDLVRMKKEENRELAEKLNEATKAFCMLCDNIYTDKGGSSLHWCINENDEIKAYFEKHQEMDEEANRPFFIESVDKNGNPTYIKVRKLSRRASDGSYLLIKAF